VITYGEALLEADRKRLNQISAIGLDETSFVRLGPKKHTSFATTMADVAHHQIIDILPTRNYTEVAGWIDAQPASWKERIRFGALDMSRIYAAVYSVTLPKASQVVDPFHLIALEATKLALPVDHGPGARRITRRGGLEFPAVRWGGPSGVIDTETRWANARWLLGDDTVKAEDRFAGLLVLLYAQWPAAISRLTTSHIEANDGDVRLRLGHEPVVLPEPLAALALHLVDIRQGHAALGDQGTSPWLFPGGQPGRPISAFRLGERLRQIGLRPGQSRSTALFQLATELPAALLARMLGIHISVAVAWQRASAGDWTDYAAYFSRRGDQHKSRPLIESPSSPTIAHS
jgi:hypothetical protein